MKALGLVLAGGRSTRFGSEKAVAELDRRPLIAWIADTLAVGCEAVAVNAPEDSGAAAWARAQGRPLLPDLPGAPDGPLSGTLEGLRWAAAAGANALVTAPCDTPRLPPNFAPRLLAALADHPCAYAVSPNGAHPPCAAWRIELLPLLREVLAAGHPSIRKLLDSWGAAQVVFPTAGPFADLNTTARFQALSSAPGTSAEGDSR